MDLLSKPTRSLSREETKRGGGARSSLDLVRVQTAHLDTHGTQRKSSKSNAQGDVAATGELAC